jgi:hypothetical protein
MAGAGAAPSRTFGYFAVHLTSVKLRVVVPDKHEILVDVSTTARGEKCVRDAEAGVSGRGCDAAACILTSNAG